jgi:hypothetical protein
MAATSVARRTSDVGDNWSMMSVVLIHGAYNELWGPHELAARWIPALQDGLWHVGSTIDPADISVCFYGDLFRHDPEAVDSRHWTSTRAGVEDALVETVGHDTLDTLTQLAGRQTYERTVALTDPVAQPGRVPDRFGSRVEERLIDNGHRGHHPEPYLNSRAVGDVVAAALAT